MPFLPTLCTPSSERSMSPEEKNAVLENLRIMGSAAKKGMLAGLLKGRRLALLSEFTGDYPAVIGEEFQLFELAATQMGAQVAHIRPGLTQSSTAQEVESTARMLGQLYDALDCGGMDVELVQQIALYAGIPVFQGLASAQHRTAALAAALSERTGSGLPDDARRRVVQAVLLGTLV
ncbi:ornithine carbamoyltransferase [Rhodoferax sp. AJA081-3]|uniref:ornithine carbamoyltransferase n=1 Tax=Rhodoferax sp. AJA081-3 TaxID=2752316 RepID=UPI001ADFE7DA|nr:ornithine carbamoyltransferase [Rhodoferax sp. AJA081-3]QTN29166.1 ornithine carbamoyltransferase [Rhodoferax sp. AJA081-3]